jgi:hypothetical protein
MHIIQIRTIGAWKGAQERSGKPCSCYLVNSHAFYKGFLSFLPLVVSHYSVLPLEVTTTQKCHRSVRCLLKNAIRYLKNAIVPLDVYSKIPLDIVIFTSNPLTMLYDKNKPRPTCQFSLSHNDKCGPLLGVSKRIILQEDKNAVGIKWAPLLIVVR